VSSVGSVRKSYKSVYSRSCYLTLSLLSVVKIRAVTNIRSCFFSSCGLAKPVCAVSPPTTIVWSGLDLDQHFRRMGIGFVLHLHQRAPRDQPHDSRSADHLRVAQARNLCRLRGRVGGAPNMRKRGMTAIFKPSPRLTSPPCLADKKPVSLIIYLLEL